MGGETSCEGEIFVGAWGGPSGKDWSYTAKGGIKQIIIRYAGVIDSIMFNAGGDEACTAEYSARFGGHGGDRTEKIYIDFPSEYLTGISGTHGRWGNFPDLITSLKFHTNRTQYGPFGKGSGNPFSFIAKGGVVSGFHGRSDNYLDAIGVYMKPACSLFKVIAMKEHSEIIVRGPGLLPRNPGPWPGCINGGRSWDDGVFSAVKAVHVHVDSHMGVVSAVQFLYEKRDASVFWSPMHGGPSGDLVKKVDFDGHNELLIGIEGFHGQVEGVECIRSLTFHTNKGKYGPMGKEMGRHFNSVGTNGRVVDFRCKWGLFKCNRPPH